MNRVRCAGIVTLAIVLAFSLALSPVQAGAKKIKAFKAQVSYTFTNSEPTPAQGLVVALSSEAEIMTDDETGAAGPFRNVSGNGSPKITLTGAASPIDVAGGENSSVELVFRSYQSKLKVNSWWWIDEKGKRIGKKQKG